MRNNIILIAFFFILSCSQEVKQLPILGNPKMVNGKEVKHTIRPFNYMSQDSLPITNATLKDQIYIVDFFFTSCPSICPRVVKQMLKIHDEFKSNPNVRLVSFTLDPKRDTPSKLKKYADNLEVKADKWLFLTGDKDFTLELAHDYFVSAAEDAEAPGGFDHSGKIILVDRNGHIRSFCEGTDPTAIPAFMEDVKTLLKEKSND
jgi:protein SCO1